MNYAVLIAELRDDPLGLGYSRMTDAEAAGAMNMERETIRVDRAAVSASEVFEAMDPAEWSSLSANEKSRVQTILGMGTVNLRGTNTRAALGAAFGAGSKTRIGVVKLQTRASSRREQLGLPVVGDGHVRSAREMF